MIYSFKTITLFLFIFAVPLACASEKSIVVSPRPDRDSLILTFSKIKSLKDAVSLAATDTYHYNTFYDAIINNNIVFKPSLLFVEKNYQLCTKILLSCAALYDVADQQKNKIDRKKYKQRFHALWPYSSKKRNNWDVFEPSLEKSPSLARQIKISLYAGRCISLDSLENALMRYLIEKEYDIVDQLIKNNLTYIQTFTNYQDSKDSFINIMYKRFGLSFIKKITDWGVNLKDYRHDDIPLGQSLICSAHDRNDEEMITFLLDQGVRNTLNFERSAEHNGILEVLLYHEFVNLNIFQLLLQRDYFNQQIKNELLGKYVESEHTEIFDLLLEHGAEKSSLSVEKLCIKGYISELKSLVQKDSTVFQKMDRWSMKHCFEYALNLPNLDILVFLCTQPGININQDFGSDGGVLFLALDKGKLDAAKVLLKHGANIHEKNIEQIYIYNKWDRPTVNFLLENGFNPAQTKKTQIKEFVKDLPRNFFDVAVFGMIVMGFGVGLAGFITILINGVEATWNGTGVA